MLGHTKTTNPDDNKATITVIYNDGTSDAMTSDHPNFARLDDIIQNVPSSQQDETEIKNLVDLVGTVRDRFRRLSEQVSVNGNTVFFDGDPLHGAITEHILRLLEEGDDRGWGALVNFLEKLASNPSNSSKESLYTYLVGRNFTILPDGNFLAYKGCRWENDVPVSIHAGPGIVNGISMNGNLPNAVGSVIEMQRSGVDANTFNGCSVGLHAGTYEYASRFSQGVLLRVSINPRDVVSVPVDCEAAKLRVCRYTVLEAEDKPYEATTYYSNVGLNTSWEDDADAEGYQAGYQDGQEDFYNPSASYPGDFPDDVTDEEVEEIEANYAAGYDRGFDDGEAAREEEENEEEDYDSEEDDYDFDDDSSDEDDSPKWNPHLPVVSAIAFPSAEVNSPETEVDSSEEESTEDEVSVEEVAPVVEEAVETDDAETPDATTSDLEELLSSLVSDTISKARKFLTNRSNHPADEN